VAAWAALHPGLREDQVSTFVEPLSVGLDHPTMAFVEVHEDVARSVVPSIVDVAEELLGDDEGGRAEMALNLHASRFVRRVRDGFDELGDFLPHQPASVDLDHDGAVACLVPDGHIGEDSRRVSHR
jgi:hypothetical protein